MVIGYIIVSFCPWNFKMDACIALFFVGWFFPLSFCSGSYIFPFYFQVVSGLLEKILAGDRSQNLK